MYSYPSAPNLYQNELKIEDTKELYPWVPSLAKGQFDTAKVIANVHDHLALMNCVKYYTSSYFAFTFLHNHSLNWCGTCGFKFRLRRNLDAKRIQSGFFTGAKLVSNLNFTVSALIPFPTLPRPPLDSDQDPYQHLKPIWPILGPPVWAIKWVVDAALVTTC